MESLNKGCLHQLLIASVIAGAGMTKHAYEAGQRHAEEKMNIQLRKSETGLTRCLESLREKECQPRKRWNPETEQFDLVQKPGCDD
jgi:hypothetical protein